MDAVPALVLADGVKVAERVSPVPEISESVPPVTTTSLLEKVVPGSSEKVKVIVAVSPLFKAKALLVMVRVGAWVSKGRDRALPAVPRLPAGSL